MTGAVRFDASGDRVSYSGSNPPDPATAITAAWWAYISVNRADFSTMIRVHAGAGASTSLNVATTGAGTSAGYFTGGGSITSSSAEPTVAAWTRMAATCTGTSGKLYVAPGAAGATVLTSGTVGGAATPTGLTLGGRAAGDSTEWFNGRLACMRIWSAVLSQAEIETEWAALTPIRTSGLWADYPLQDATDLTDHSGNGRHLVAGSTAVTTEAGPPITEPTGNGRFLAFF